MVLVVEGSVLEVTGQSLGNERANAGFHGIERGMGCGGQARLPQVYLEVRRYSLKYSAINR